MNQGLSRPFSLKTRLFLGFVTENLGYGLLLPSSQDYYAKLILKKSTSTWNSIFWRWAGWYIFWIWIWWQFILFAHTIYGSTVTSKRNRWVFFFSWNRDGLGRIGEVDPIQPVMSLNSHTNSFSRGWKSRQVENPRRGLILLVCNQGGKRHTNHDGWRG